MADGCDKVKGGDARFAAVQALVAADGCGEQNGALEACLARSERLFALCRPQTEALRACLARRAQKP